MLDEDVDWVDGSGGSTCQSDMKGQETGMNRRWTLQEQVKCKTETSKDDEVQRAVCTYFFECREKSCMGVGQSCLDPEGSKKGLHGGGNQDWCCDGLYCNEYYAEEELEQLDLWEKPDPEYAKCERKKRTPWHDS